MSMIGTLKERDGQLFVLYETARESEPVLVFLWWKVERVIRNVYNGETPQNGDRVAYTGGGHWHVIDRAAGGGVYTGDGTKQADKREEVSAPVPKVRRGIELRWHQGQWEKRLARGWVRA